MPKIVAHLDYSWRTITKKRCKETFFSIYHLEINQPIKKSNFDRTRKKLNSERSEPSDILEKLQGKKITKQLGKSGFTMRFAKHIYPSYKKLQSLLIYWVRFCVDIKFILIRSSRFTFPFSYEHRKIFTEDWNISRTFRYLRLNLHSISDDSLTFNACVWTGSLNNQ